MRFVMSFMIIVGVFISTMMSGVSSANAVEGLSVEITKINADNQRIENAVFDLKKIKDSELFTYTEIIDSIDRFNDNQEFEFDTELNGTTNKVGSLTFGSLEKGVYVLTEKFATPGSKISKPMIIPVPYISKDLGVVNNVQVFPKSELLVVDKKVIDGSSIVSDSGVLFEVKVRATEDGEFVFSDKIEDGLIVDRIEVFDSNKSLVPVDEYSLSINDNNVVIDFKKPQAFSILIYTKTLNEGIFKNTAAVRSVDIVSSSNEVVTKWGGFTIKKVNERGEPLAGAEFLIKGNGKKIASVVTDKNGLATVENVRYSEFANNVDINNKSKDFILYSIEETVAPDGYILDKRVLDVKVDSNASDNLITVKNLKKVDVPTGLLATGISSGLIILITGLTLFMFAINRKKDIVDIK